MCKGREGLGPYPCSPLTSECFLSTWYQSCHDEEDDDGEEEVKSFEVRLYFWFCFCFCFFSLSCYTLFHSFRLKFMFLGSWLAAA